MSGKYIDCGKNIVYNECEGPIEPELVEEIQTKQGLRIEIWNVDLQHAFNGHPEVTLDRIRKALESPVKVVKSKKSNRVCLFYTLEVADDSNFGKVYFCVVVGVLGAGIGKMETAYETTVIKTGHVLYSKESSNDY